MRARMVGIAFLFAVLGCNRQAPRSESARSTREDPAENTPSNAASTAAQRVETTPTPKPTRKTPPPRRTPAAVRSAGPCGKLPSVEVMRTWNVKRQPVKHCTGHQGPRPPPGGYPPREMEHPGAVVDLGDGTYLVKERTGCVRVRFYPVCNQK